MRGLGCNVIQGATLGSMSAYGFIVFSLFTSNRDRLSYTPELHTNQVLPASPMLYPHQ